MFEEQTSGDACLLQPKMISFEFSLPWDMHFNYTLIFPISLTYTGNWLCGLQVATQTWSMDFEKLELAQEINFVCGSYIKIFKWLSLISLG